MQNNTAALQRKAKKRKQRKFSPKSKKTAFSSFQKAGKKQQESNPEFYTPYVSKRNEYDGDLSHGLSIEEQNQELINMRDYLRESYGHNIIVHPKIFNKNNTYKTPFEIAAEIEILSQKEVEKIKKLG